MMLQYVFYVRIKTPDMDPDPYQDSHPCTTYTRVVDKIDRDPPSRITGSRSDGNSVPGPILDRHILDRTKPRQDQT